MRLAVAVPTLPTGMPLYLLIAGVGLLIYLASKSSPRTGNPSEMPRTREPRVEVFMGNIERYE